MNKNFAAFNFINYSIWFEMYFQIVSYVDAQQFRGNVAAFGKLIQTVAELFQLFEYIIRTLRRIMSQNVFVDVQKIIFGIIDNIYLKVHWSSLIRDSRFLKDFFTVLYFPSLLLFEL